MNLGLCAGVTSALSRPQRPRQAQPFVSSLLPAGRNHLMAGVRDGGAAETYIGTTLLQGEEQRDRVILLIEPGRQVPAQFTAARQRSEGVRMLNSLARL